MKISQKVSELQIQIVELTLGRSQFTKGHNSIKTVDGVTVLNSAQLYIVPSFKKISQTVSQLLSRCHLHTEIFKGHNSVKNVDGAMILVLCTSSDNALYLYQVLPKYLKGFQSNRPKQQGRH